MLLPITQLVPPDALGRLRQLMDQGPFGVGASTAVGSAARVKDNLQLVPSSAAATEASRVLVAALRAHAAFQAATYMSAMMTPIFCRYEPGMHYGDHIDSPIMGVSPLLRSDISVTVWLNDAQEYEGGELVIDSAGLPRSFKANAGDALLYPSDTLHRVEPVTRGVRLVAVFWIQSLVRDPAQRRILFDLSQVLSELAPLAENGPALDRLRRCTMNLLRMWAEGQEATSPVAR